MIFPLNTCLADRFKATRLMIVHQSLDLGLSVAKRTAGMLPDRKRSKFCFQRIVNQELTDQRFPLLQDKFNGFHCLNQSNLPGYNSQDTCLVSARDQTWRGGLGEEAP